MIVFLRDAMASIFLDWNIKDHPYITILLRGIFVGLVMLFGVMMTRYFNEGAAFLSLNQDIKLSFIFGTLVVLFNLLIVVLRKLWKYLLLDP